MNSTPVSCGMVIPAYRESARIKPFLAALCETLTPLPQCRVLVVDDGSGAEEQRRLFQIVNDLRSEYSNLLVPLLLEKNLGKGGAILAGWKQLAEEVAWLGFADADGASPASEVFRILNSLPGPQEKPACFFASRVKMLGKTVDRKLYRHLIGRVYATIVSNCLGLPVYDSQCGLKVIPTVAFKHIEPFLGTNDFAFDVELLAALVNSGFQVLEVPINWSDVPGSKVHLIRDSFKMLSSVWKISRRYRLGEKA